MIPLEIINEYGIDPLRYYLVKEVSLGNDGSISLKSLHDCINNDLANNYGNLCQRVFSFLQKNNSSKIPKPPARGSKRPSKASKAPSEVSNTTSKAPEASKSSKIQYIPPKAP